MILLLMMQLNQKKYLVFCNGEGDLIAYTFDQKKKLVKNIFLSTKKNLLMIKKKEVYYFGRGTCRTNYWLFFI